MSQEDILYAAGGKNINTCRMKKATNTAGGISLDLLQEETITKKEDEYRKLSKVFVGSNGKTDSSNQIYKSV